MADMVLYVVSLLVPVVLSGCLILFTRFRRSAKHAARWPQLVAGNVLLLFLLVSVLFLIGENYFRFWSDATDSFSQMRTNQKWVDRHVERNNAGFRDSLDYVFRRRSTRPRFSFVGDSFTAGHGIANVEHRFANRIRAAKRGAWEVHVLAEGGRDTGAELKLIHDLANLRYEFDTIILVYCLNDINDLVAEEHQSTGAPAPARPPGFLVEHSFLVNTLYYRFRARFDPKASKYYDFVRTAYDGSTWQKQQDRLKTIKDVCESAGGRLLVVLFPFVHALGAENEYQQIHDKLQVFWRSLDVPCLDLLPMFETYAREPLVVNRYDAHPNEQAHGLAAGSICDFLEQQLDLAAEQ